MARVIVYYAHPGRQHSVINAALQQRIQSCEDIERVDLYAEYPRLNINISREQQRLTNHDIIVFQFPVFWYSSPSIVKEWFDLVLESGFAFGKGGDKLEGKRFMLALTAGASKQSYGPGERHGHPLRVFLYPFEQSAHLCGMEFISPYVCYDAIASRESEMVQPHVDGFAALLEGLRDETVDLQAVQQEDTFGFAQLPQFLEG